MNMLPIYLTDVCSLGYLALLSFLFNAAPLINPALKLEITPEMWRLQHEATRSAKRVITTFKPASVLFRWRFARFCWSSPD